MSILDDPEYCRLVSAFKEAKGAGNFDLANTYFRAAMKRGDELAVPLGAAPWLPIADALDRVADSFREDG